MLGDGEEITQMDILHLTKLHEIKEWNLHYALVRRFVEHNAGCYYADLPFSVNNLSFSANLCQPCCSFLPVDRCSCTPDELNKDCVSDDPFCGVHNF